MKVEITNPRPPRRAGLWAVLGLTMLLLGCAPDRGDDDAAATGAGGQTGTGAALTQLSGRVVQPGNAGALIEVDGQQMLVSSLQVEGGTANLKPGDSLSFGVDTRDATTVAVTPGVSTMRDQNGLLFQIPSSQLGDAAREGSSAPSADDAIAIGTGNAETGMVLSQEGERLVVLVTRPQGLQLATTELSGLQGEDVGSLTPGTPITFAVTDDGIIASRWGEVTGGDAPVSAQPMTTDEAGAIGAGEDTETDAIGAGAETEADEIGAGADAATDEVGAGVDADADTDVSTDVDADADVSAETDTEVDVAGDR